MVNKVHFELPNQQVDSAAVASSYDDAHLNRPSSSSSSSSCSLPSGIANGVERSSSLWGGALPAASGTLRSRQRKGLLRCRVRLSHQG